MKMRCNFAQKTSYGVIMAPRKNIVTLLILCQHSDINITTPKIWGNGRDPHNFANVLFELFTHFLPLKLQNTLCSSKHPRVTLSHIVTAFMPPFCTVLPVSKKWKKMQTKQINPYVYYLPSLWCRLLNLQQKDVLAKKELVDTVNWTTFSGLQ